MDRATKLLEEAGQRITLLTENLPRQVDAASLSLSSKLPLKALTYREAALCRCEELARSAHDSFFKGNNISGIVLTRAFTETVAGVWYLLELVDRQVEVGVEPDLDEELMKLLMGQMNQEGFPKAINVLNFLRGMDKSVPGILGAYNSMSEYSHPNWAGTAFAYAAPNRENLITGFGVNSGRKRSHDMSGLNWLNGGLGLLEFAYNKLAELFPRFIVACEANLVAKRKAGGSGNTSTQTESR